MSSQGVLIDRLRTGDLAAWEELIALFEGRLLAFVESRLQRRDTAEDIVQETFIGFLTSLPNYDPARSLESYLFSIAAHKLTDHLRREGRRVTVQTVASRSSDGTRHLPSRDRPASSLLRSGERKQGEATALAAGISEQLERWRQNNEFQKIKCAELLFVSGWGNKRVAEQVDLSEQAVANQKFEFLERLRTSIRKLPQKHRGPTAHPALGANPAESEIDCIGLGQALADSPPPGMKIAIAELEGYLDESLPAERMTAVEEALRRDPRLLETIAAIHGRRDAGVHSLSEVWRRHRLSCPSRQQLGNYLLAIAPEETADYIRFHLETVGCRYCLANKTDLETQRSEAAAAIPRRRKYLQSSAGHLRKR